MTTPTALTTHGKGAPDAPGPPREGAPDDEHPNRP